MTTTAEAPTIEIKHVVQDAVRELNNKLEAGRPQASRNTGLSRVPSEGRLSNQDVKCVNHLICAMVLSDAWSAIDAQITSLSAQHVLELLA